MPANKNAMTRYKILDDLLSNRYHNYSLDDLTEEVNLRLSEMYPQWCCQKNDRKGHILFRV